ncbi:hypothetical protein [Kitasatospora mediocidica]|uniref:hypothetical protein n=1 Tax=Kitasatospora mediocidica TaxID=58352 RepID=UPI000A459E7F|nr:hypothetical protein [Kitasatospora mediocidica]
MADEIPVGDPATPRLQAARGEAWAAERLFAERFVELAGTDGRGAGTDWQTGDLVLAADGHLWVRAYPEDVAKGWAWAHSTEQVGASSGAVEEEYPERPLTLLVREGKPVGGVRVVE